MNQNNLFEDYTKFGFYKTLLKDRLSSEDISFIQSYINEILPHTPFFTPTMKNGKPFNVQITSLGLVGWISDNRGYRYEKKHPNGNTWLGIPLEFYEIIKRYFDLFNLKYNPQSFDTCLINSYSTSGSLGMHFDKDEKDLKFPIVSFSIGADAVFNIELGNMIQSYTLTNGDVVIMDNKARNAKHGIKKVNGKRLNLTFRKAL